MEPGDDTTVAPVSDMCCCCSCSCEWDTSRRREARIIEGLGAMQDGGEGAGVMGMSIAKSSITTCVVRFR